jgi:hypothetical protein
MANFLKSLFVKGVEIDPAGAASDQVLKYNGTKFVPGTASTVGSIDDLSDVAVTSPVTNQVLTYNGTLWTNASASGATSASISIADTPPSSPSVGAFWFESDTGKTFIYYDSAWVEMIGGGSGSVQETTLTTNSATTITRFDKTAMRSGEFLIQVTQGSKYTVSKILLIHNGTTPTLAEYGVIELGTTRIPLTISTSISGSDVLVQATVTDAGTTSAYVKVISSLVGL